jgi:hypothetical protein
VAGNFSESTMFMQRSILCLFAVIFFMVVSCKKEDIPIAVTPTLLDTLNVSPIAVAGDDMTVDFSNGFRFYLNGSQSYPTNPGVTMVWRKISGPELIEFSDFGMRAEYIPSTFGAYTFELTIDNGKFKSRDSVTIIVATGSCNPDLEYVKAEFTEESVYANSVTDNANACVASGRLVIAGGADWGGASKEMHIYDAAAKKWTSADMSVARWDVSIGANKEYAFFTGANGYPSTSDLVDIYEFSTGKITTTKLSIPRQGVSVSVAPNKALFAGGLDSKGSISDVIDIYDIGSKTWSTTKFPSPRNGMVSTVVGNKIYYTGGFSDDGGISDRLDIYDLSSGQWNLLRMNRGRYAPGIAVMGGSKLVFTGGYDFSGPEPGFASDMSWLDLSTSTFKQECLFGDYYTSQTTNYSFRLASVFVGQNLFSCYNKYLTRFDVSANKWLISKGMNDQDLSGFFSDGDRLLGISTKNSGIDRHSIKIYEVKF